MRIVGFLVFIAGLAFGWWWLALIGLVLFEATGITWMAAATTNHNHVPHGMGGNPHDHGP